LIGDTPEAAFLGATTVSLHEIINWVRGSGSTPKPVT
jgi:hypothetical protein